jgi:hypothetical protein
VSRASLSSPLLWVTRRYPPTPPEKPAACRVFGVRSAAELPAAVSLVRDVHLA